MAHGTCRTTAGNTGFRTDLLLAPDQRVAVVVMANSEAGPSQLSRALIEAVLADRGPRGGIRLRHPGSGMSSHLLEDRSVIPQDPIGHRRICVEAPFTPVASPSENDPVASREHAVVALDQDVIDLGLG